MEIGIVGQALAATGATQAGLTRAPASARAMEQFAAAFGVSAGDDVKASAVDAAPASFLERTLAVADATPTLGSQILNGLRAGVAGFSDKWTGMAARLNAVAEQPEMGNLLRLQADMLQLSVQYEVVGKAVTRSTQNLDTLVRMN
ncbi:type III secretion system inner rod subunit SctI [Achromobacter xylosoxidans]